MGMLMNLLRVTPTELAAYQQDSDALETRIYAAAADPALTDLDKTWDGIIYLLTGAPVTQATHPLVSVLFSGQLLDVAQDLGYGPAHYLTPTQVAGLHPQLAAIDPAELRARFDPANMQAQGVYPDIWAEGEDALTYVLDGYETLRQEYATAAQRGEGLLTWLS
jgi:hypothetical protein